MAQILAPISRDPVNDFRYGSSIRWEKPSEVLLLHFSRSTIGKLNAGKPVRADIRRKLKALFDANPPDPALSFESEVSAAQ